MGYMGDNSNSIMTTHLDAFIRRNSTLADMKRSIFMIELGEFCLKR